MNNNLDLKDAFILGGGKNNIGDLRDDDGVMAEFTVTQNEGHDV